LTPDQLIDPQTRGKNSIGLNLIISREFTEAAKMLEKCLPFMQQIVVVHDGPCYHNWFKAYCLDSGMMFIEAPSTASCGGWPNLHRRLALANTYTDWLFQIDSDEMPSDLLLENLSSLVNRGGINCYTIPMIMVVDGKVISNYSLRKLVRILPSLQWSMLPHIETNVPEPVSDSIPEDWCIIHTHTTDWALDRNERNSKVASVVMQRWGDIPDVVEHVRRMTGDCRTWL
jgi:hypothetical protein